MPDLMLLGYPRI